MSYLHWSCSNDVKEDVLRLLAEYDRETTVLGSGNGMPVISISSPDPEALRLTVDLLAQKRRRAKSRRNASIVACTARAGAL